jgi:CSLREA domain-containing protein
MPVYAPLPQPSSRALTLALALLIGLSTLSPAASTPALAASFAVTSAADSPDANLGDGRCADSAGACTLRAAVMQANALAGPDSIMLPAGVYRLTRSGTGENSAASGDLDVSGQLSIVGAGAGTTIVDAGGLSTPDRTLHILGGAGAVSLAGLTLTGGRLNDSSAGGAILNAADLTLDAVVVRGNRAASGGGIGNSGSGTLTIRNSTISGNSAADDGGGIFNNGQRVRITNSTISGNSAADDGGGFAQASSSSGEVFLNSVTITANGADADNSSRGDGGGIAVGGQGRFSLRNTIIAANSDARGGGRPDCSTPSGQGANFDLVSYSLIGSNVGCESVLPPGGTSLVNAAAQPLNLGALADNGGPTPTHALLTGSRAINTGDPAGCRDDQGSPLVTDQRGSGFARVFDGRCDIGAFEFGDPPQAGPVLTVNHNADPGDGVCTLRNCTLREAIARSNALAPSGGVAANTIRFNLQGDATITPASALPAVQNALRIDGLSQGGAGYSGPPLITLAGTSAGASADGLRFDAGGGVSGLAIRGFGGSGIRVAAGGVTVERNTIRDNRGDGGTVTAGVGTTIRANSFDGNRALAIDLAAGPASAGVTANDPGDGDDGPNGLQNFPLLLSAVPGSAETLVGGRISSRPNTSYSVEFYASTSCDASGHGEGQEPLGSISVTTNGFGDAALSFTAPRRLSGFVTAIATDPGGSSSEFAPCIRAGADNTSWPKALRLTLDASLPAIESQVIDAPGQSRWFKFRVVPGEVLTISLSSLPANYDLTVYNDIAFAYQEILDYTRNFTLSVLARQNAELYSGPCAGGPGARSGGPGARSGGPGARSGTDACSGGPGARSGGPGARSGGPGARSGDIFDPAVFSPDQYIEEIYGPTNVAAETIAPVGAGPRELPPGALDQETPSVQNFDPTIFASAQTRAVIAGSAQQGTIDELVVVNTWDNARDFYVRVRAASSYDLNDTFQLELRRQLDPVCRNVLPITTARSLQASSGNYQTLILVDESRLAANGLTGAILAKLQQLASAPSVRGVIVDVSDDARVRAANAQADAPGNLGCPYAKNLVAHAIKEVVDAYRAANPLKYIVIIGNDNVVPFFRYPDKAEHEDREFRHIPPVDDQSASQATLRRGYMMGQDEYGASQSVSYLDSRLPLPELAVGRLVETDAEVGGMIDAYLSGTSGGVVPTPSRALVTGYDFMSDGAEAVRAELASGLGSATAVNTLIAERTCSPLDSACTWDAGDLRQQLLGSGRHDIVYLAGHFTAHKAIAADEQSSLSAAEVALSPVDMRNAIVFSAGCHSGYNIVNSDMLAALPRDPDWAQAFARKQATLIAATGFQYGDTQFVEYGEELYRQFSRQLRSGSGPVAVGAALVDAKQAFLAGLGVNVLGLHQKTYIISTLYGLPMLSLNLAGARLSPEPVSPLSLENAPGGTPGSALGLKYDDITLSPSLALQSIVLSNTDDLSQSLVASYLSGPDGTLVRPYEPILPLDERDVSVPGRVLQGIGNRGGNYSDRPVDAIATGAPATELHRPRQLFCSDVFYPLQTYGPNYFDLLANGASGRTRLVLTPAQFRTAGCGSPQGTLRSHLSSNLRLFYSDNYGQSAYGDSRAYLAAPPSILRVASTFDPASRTVAFEVNVIGDPNAGIQETWLLYTADAGPLYGTWRPLDLTQDEADSTLWRGQLALPVGQPDKDVRFVVQAASGMGLVTLASNEGAFYALGEDTSRPPAAAASAPTTLTLSASASAVAFGDPITLTARLRDEAGAGVANRLVIFDLGGLSRRIRTDATGTARARLNLALQPADYTAEATFEGDATYKPATAAALAIEVRKRPTSLSISPPPIFAAPGIDSGIVVTLTTPVDFTVRYRTLFLSLKNGSGATVFSAAEATNFGGQVRLPALPALPDGSYNLEARFSGQITLPGETLVLEDPYFEPSSASRPLVVDGTPPTLTVTVSPTLVLLNGSATIISSTFDSGSGVPPGGVVCSPLDTSSIGLKTISCTATDRAGNRSAPVTASYQVGYRFVGFGPPVANNGVYNIAQAGRTVPLKFQLLDAAGAPVSISASAVSVGVRTVSCPTSPPTSTVGEYSSGEGLVSLGGGSYQYNWKTARSYPSPCQEMQLRVNGVVVGTALFRFR